MVAQFNDGELARVEIEFDASIRRSAIAKRSGLSEKRKLDRPHFVFQAFRQGHCSR